MTEETMKNTSIKTEIGAWGVTTGILMMLFGAVVIVFSVLTTFATILALGIILTARGLVEVVYALFTARQEWFWRRLLSGILPLVIGVLILTRPGLTAASVTLFVAVFLLVNGLFKTIAAPLAHRARWGWEMFAGIISLLIGLWVWIGWPSNALWLIGTLVGVEIVIQGIALVMLPFVFGRPVGRGTAAFA